MRNLGLPLRRPSQSHMPLPIASPIQYLSYISFAKQKLTSGSSNSLLASDSSFLISQTPSFDYLASPLAYHSLCWACKTSFSARWLLFLATLAPLVRLASHLVCQFPPWILGAKVFQAKLKQKSNPDAKA